MTKWFQVKEQAAGTKRLLLTWWIYKHFGEFPLRLIAFFITAGTFVHAKDLRKYSKKYFEVLYKFTGKKSLKPSNLNSFKHFLNYANSLADKMLAFTGNYSPEKLTFATEDLKADFEKIMDAKQGAFLISTHIGNIEMMREFMFLKDYAEKVKVNAFMQKTQCEIFNGFLEKISQQHNLELFAIEDIDIETSIKIKEKLENGELVYMAGDRLSAQTEDKFYEISFLNRTIKLPLGIMRFILLLECPVYFIVCAKEQTKYVIDYEKFIPAGDKKENLAKIQKEFGEFLEKNTLKYPYQFYHFYDLFGENTGK